MSPKPSTELAVAEFAKLTEQQKRNVGTIAYALHLKGIVVSADEIYNAWPVGGDFFTQQKAGKRPSRGQIAHYLGTDEGKNDLLNRGLSVTHEDIIGDDGLTQEQIALITILSDTTSTLSLDARLRKAGVKRSVFRAWQRQAAFNAAYRKIVSEEMILAKENVDIALTKAASNGDLKAIQYYNELMGRGPNSKKDVDAIAFSRLVLEAVMRHCTKDQIAAISTDIEFAAKQAGLETA